ncbi:MAG: cache domain-containing protein, partial [Deltaproteobacteria bacterium]|nr:cache domain-containing protein [Deltaproteobacteria bacterium]
GLLVICWLLAGALPATAHKGIYDWAFVSLDYARQEKVQQLQRFCDRIHKLARDAAADPMLNDCFKINLAYQKARELNDAPATLIAKIETLRQSLSRYYVDNYFSFYDIIFVDRRGRITFCLRREYGNNENLLTQVTPLAEGLKAASDREIFVDFYDYGPSSEPAAFFVEPVFDHGQHLGWIVLQCAINKVNTIFSGTENLGQTGETFLVNQQGQMLTESNFLGNSTILKKKLDDRNIQTKFAELQGHRTVIDYRERRALTSFEVVNFINTRWLVVAKVDRGEIVTTHYARHRQYYADRIREALAQVKAQPAVEQSLNPHNEILRIDMDEFARAGNDQELCTFGIATCTGLIAAFPGKFAYMAHISPNDRLYGQSGSHLLGQIIKKIKSFDIYPSEKRALEFTIIAPHQESFATAIDKLIDEGFFLSQIKLVYNPTAVSGSISYNYRDNRLRTFWKKADKIEPQQFFPQVETLNVGAIIQAVMVEDEEKL